MEKFEFDDEGSRSAQELSRSKSDTKPAICLTGGTQQIGRAFPFVHARDWMNLLECLGSDPTSNAREFPARRKKFPVPDHREFVAITAERLVNLGADSLRGA